ncbi:unnamed protein product [Symbiodinium natans]|uniref:Uncharacterized protein n=1 Tax=Symbiodinium natans TaxID=878477 RepID=A0A812S8T8_9DINO|nr:unnamed protein product [Symbiodinium natans]
MCWSFEVSLVFGTLELLTIFVLLRRNQHHDRCLATLLFPIMMQELCQMMIWQYVGENASTCPAENFFWGKAANLFYESVPLFANIAAWQWLWWKLPDKWTWDIHLLIASTVLAFAGYVLSATNRFYVLPPACTFPGPCGHLLFFPQENAIVVPLGGIYYMFPLFAAGVIDAGDGRLRGRWGLGGVAVLGVIETFTAVLYFNNQMPSFLYRETCNPDEFYSTWCWQAYFIAIWALLEVWIYRKVVDPNWQVPGPMSSGLPDSEGERSSLTAP